MRERFPPALLEAFRRRGRAIVHRGATVDSVLVPDQADDYGEVIDRCEITIAFRVDGRSVLIRAHAWEDRWLWIDARHSSKKGWTWEFSTEGRLLPPPSPAAVITRLESMMDAAHQPPVEVPRLMSAIWTHALAKGLRREG